MNVNATKHSKAKHMPQKPSLPYKVFNTINKDMFALWCIDIIACGKEIAMVCWLVHLQFNYLNMYNISNR